MDQPPSSSSQLAALRAEFPIEQQGVLTRLTCKDCSNAKGASRGACAEHPKTRCATCGGWLSPRHIHISYVGHATVTERLLDIDPTWTWQPMGVNDDGTPKITTRGDQHILWIELTVCDVTRPGVGIVASDANELEKQLIGDAIRNAAMRFGVALDLWKKDDKRAAVSTPAPAPPVGVDPDTGEMRTDPARVNMPKADATIISEIRSLCEALSIEETVLSNGYSVWQLDDLNPREAEQALAELHRRRAAEPARASA